MVLLQTNPRLHRQRQHFILENSGIQSSAEFNVDDSVPCLKRRKRSNNEKDNDDCPKQKKSVSFAKTINIRPSLHMEDMTDEETLNTWYQRYEFDEFKTEMVVTVKYMMTGRLQELNPNEFTTRGLEARTRAGSEKRKLNKLQALNAVMDEQDEQDMRGIVDQQAISDAYCSHAIRSAKMAFLKGLQDQQEANRINKEQRMLNDTVNGEGHMEGVDSVSTSQEEQQPEEEDLSSSPRSKNSSRGRRFKRLFQKSR